MFNNLKQIGKYWKYWQ